MHIQAITSNERSQAFKALYFSKTPTVMLDKAIEFMPHEKVATTSKGIRYLKDTDISQSIKKHFGNIPFVKKMAKKYDTFIWFINSKQPDGYRACAKITRIKDGQIELPAHYVIGKSQCSQETATECMFTALKNKNFTVL